MKSLRRWRIGLTAITFFGIAAACWVDPRRMAAVFGIQAENGQGLASVCADLGGLFLGLGALLAHGAMTRRRGPLLAGATLLGAIACGRLVGWLCHAGVPLGARELGIEAGTALTLLLFARGADASADAPRAGR